MNFKFLSVLVLLISLVSCEKNDSDVEYDFSVLGMEKITIDNVVVSLDSCGFPDVKSNSFVMTGFSNESSRRTYDLVFKNSYSEGKSIHIESKFNDISVKIDHDAISECYNITVSRAGFNVTITYKINFLKTPTFRSDC